MGLRGAFAFTLVMALASGRVQAEPPRLALVIGNGSYTALPPLPSCLASARIVTATLQRAGYTVREQTNESNGRLGTAASEFADALAAAPGAKAVLYFCGYAVGFSGRVFLLPTPATLERPTDALTQGVVAKLLTAAITGAPLSAGLVLLDTVGTPGSDPAIPLDTLLDKNGPDVAAIVAVRAGGTAPQGPTTLAVAFSAAFAQPSVELKATVQTLRGAFTGQPAALAIREPGATLLLAGEPPAADPVPLKAAPSPATSAAGPAADVVFTPSPGEIRRAQLALTRLGYFKGTVDGVLGPESLAAIKRYQAENKLDPTGRLTAEAFAQLLEAGR